MSGDLNVGIVLNLGVQSFRHRDVRRRARSQAVARGHHRNTLAIAIRIPRYAPAKPPLDCSHCAPGNEAPTAGHRASPQRSAPFCPPYSLTATRPALSITVERTALPLSCLYAPKPECPAHRRPPRPLATGAALRDCSYRAKHSPGPFNRRREPSIQDAYASAGEDRAEAETRPRVPTCVFNPFFCAGKKKPAFRPAICLRGFGRGDRLFLHTGADRFEYNPDSAPARHPARGRSWNRFSTLIPN